MFQLKVSLRGPKKGLSSREICDTVNYIEKNLLSELGLHINSATIYFTIYDEHGNYVVPGIDQQGISITHDLYFDEYLVDPNPKETILGNRFAPIDRFLSDKRTLLSTAVQAIDKTLALEIKGIREASGMTVRQLEQVSGINGQVICEYERGVRKIPLEDLTTIKNAIHDFSEGNCEIASIDSELAKIETIFKRKLTSPEKKRFIEIIKIGMTDDAIKAARKITYDRLGHNGMAYMCALLMNWAKNGLYGGDTR